MPLLFTDILSPGKECGLSVTQIFPEGGNLGLVLPSDLCQWTTDKVRQEGVTVHPGTLLSTASLDEGKVKVTLSNGEVVSYRVSKTSCISDCMISHSVKHVLCCIVNPLLVLRYLLFALHALIG